MMRAERPLGDTPDRSYAEKLDLFAQFATPELHRIFAGLTLPAHGKALDLGCGTGVATMLLSEALGPNVTLVGVDLSLPHLRTAARGHELRLVQADAERLCFRERAFDFIWSCNTINHVANRVGAIAALRQRLCAGGRLVLAQSGLLPEMFFAWDAHFDDAVRLACHRYYRERYDLEASDTEAIRSIVGLMHSAGFESVRVQTYVIERTQPLSRADREYFQTAIFEGTWGERIKPFLDSRSVRKLERNCDPGSSDYCLNRHDFHHIQTITICEGAVND